MRYSTDHLWEIKHPYYCNESHYFGTGGGGNVNDSFRTFADFAKAYKNSDFDLNLVFRWDWDENTDDKENVIEPPDWNYRNGILKIFWFVQRKGFHRVSEVEVCRNDEEAVIAFLRPRWEHMRKLWDGTSA